ncbi:MAG: hypothetical protein IJD01_00060, partial [Clostridia bacterium]|nr:hypothetical protein [Clostridia bacterium]
MKLWRSFVATVCAVAILLGMLPAVVTAEEISGAVSAKAADNSETVLDLSSLTAEDVLGEDETRREANVKHFKLTDGSMVAVSYPIAVHEE